MIVLTSHGEGKYTAGFYHIYFIYETRRMKREKWLHFVFFSNFNQTNRCDFKYFPTESNVVRFITLLFLSFIQNEARCFYYSRQQQYCCFVVSCFFFVLFIDFYTIITRISFFLME